MANQMSHLLSHWHPLRDQLEWVLGTVYKTEGPCYRKAGAMMLFNSLGQQFGMLSGGCLESDIQTHARRVMQTGQPVTLCYDGSDEDDLSFQLGIGCGGTVHIQLQPIRKQDEYLQLDKLLSALQKRQAGWFYQPIHSAGQPVSISGRFIVAEQTEVTAGSELLEENAVLWLKVAIQPEPHLLVVGGGVDARPVASIASKLGWRVSLWDPRPANGRREFFLDVDYIVEADVSELGQWAHAHNVNCAVLMAHNIGLDAAALAQLQPLNLEYMALLGPFSRRQKVLDAVGLEASVLANCLAGPAGLSLGGELPESIALSILSECHAKLNKHQAESISGVLG